MVLEGLLLGLGLARFAFSLAVVLGAVSEVEVGLMLLLLEGGFWLTESGFEDLDVDLVGSVAVGEDATSGAGVSTFSFREEDVSLGVSSVFVSFVDVDDVFGMGVNGAVSTVSSMGIDVPGETGGELSFLGAA